MPRSTASGLRITPAVAAFYNYQIHPPSVKAELNVYAKGALPRRDFTGFRSRKQREEDDREQHLARISSPYATGD
jgi:hypothetical protein